MFRYLHLLNGTRYVNKVLKGKSGKKKETFGPTLEYLDNVDIENCKKKFKH